MAQTTVPLQYIPDHRTRALTLMPSQFQEERPVLAAFMHALGEGSQTLEDVIFDLMVGTRFDAATGANLDIWGDLVGETRGALRDTDYRRFIAARILANRSSGEGDDLIEIAQLITAESTVWLEAYFPAELIITVFRESPMTDAVVDRVAAMMSEVRGIGIKLQVIEATGGYLGFSENPAASPMPIGFLARNILT